MTAPNAMPAPCIPPPPLIQAADVAAGRTHPVTLVVAPIFAPLPPVGGNNATAEPSLRATAAAGEASHTMASNATAWRDSRGAAPPRASLSSFSSGTRRVPLVPDGGRAGWRRS